MHEIRSHVDGKPPPIVIEKAQAQATRYIKSPSTGNQLDKHRKHRQPVIQAAKTQAIRYVSSPSIDNQPYKQRKHRQSLIQAAQTQATN